MDLTNVKEIIRILLADMGITATDNHYEYAIKYFQENNALPDMDYLIGVIVELDADNAEFHEIEQRMQIRADNMEEHRNENRENHESDSESGSDSSSGSGSGSGSASDSEENENFDFTARYQDVSEGEAIRHILRNSNDLDVKKVIKNINDIKLTMYKNNTTSTNTECFVCYDRFVDTDLVRILPCSHILHRMCIDDHLTKKSYLCPYCQKPAGDYQCNI